MSSNHFHPIINFVNISLNKSKSETELDVFEKNIDNEEHECDICGTSNEIINFAFKQQSVCQKNKMSINICPLCKLLFSRNRNDLIFTCICESSLNQIDIIKQTYDYFVKNNTIPSPQTLDKKVKLSDISSNDLLNIDVNKLDVDKFINKTKKLKFFFTHYASEIITNFSSNIFVGGSVEKPKKVDVDIQKFYNFKKTSNELKQYIYEAFKTSDIVDTLKSEYRKINEKYQICILKSGT